jgi:hypothetical protein
VTAHVAHDQILSDVRPLASWLRAEICSIDLAEAAQ